ncbi:hypothetical protein ACFV7P_18515 [Bacillus subtilis]
MSIQEQLDKVKFDDIIDILRYENDVEQYPFLNPNGRYEVSDIVISSSMYVRNGGFVRKKENSIFGRKRLTNYSFIVDTIGYNMRDTVTNEYKMVSKEEAAVLAVTGGLTNGYMRIRKNKRSDDTIRIDPYKEKIKGFTTENRIICGFKLDENKKLVFGDDGRVVINVSEKDCTRDLWEQLQTMRISKRKKCSKKLGFRKDGRYKVLGAVTDSYVVYSGVGATKAKVIGYKVVDVNLQQVSYITQDELIERAKNYGLCNAYVIERTIRGKTQYLIQPNDTKITSFKDKNRLVTAFETDDDGQIQGLKSGNLKLSIKEDCCSKDLWSIIQNQKDNYLKKRKYRVQ